MADTLKEDFLRAVQALRSPIMGTEAASPLTYQLIRACRFQRVIETGAGYSSLFIAQALADNLTAFNLARAQLRDKTKPLAACPEDELPADLVPGNIGWTWALTAPELADPDYYEKPYEPILYTIDNFAIPAPYSSASKVSEMFEQLGLDHVAKLLNVDFRGGAAHIPKQHQPVDLILWDGGVKDSDPAELIELFLRDYWPMLDEGGMAILHETDVPTFLKAIHAKYGLTVPDDLELVQLREPHKFVQNGMLLVRRIGPKTKRAHGFDAPKVFRSGRRWFDKHGRTVD